MRMSRHEPVRALDDCMAALARLRSSLDRDRDEPVEAAANPSHVDVDGHSWGSPVLGFTRVTLSFQVIHRYTYWSFNFWKVAFAIHIPSRKAREDGNVELAAWLAAERERTFESTLTTLLAKKKRAEAIELVRDARNLSTKQAMEFVDQRISNATLSDEHLTKLNANVKVNDRIAEEYKELAGDMPLQARF
jgi:hypothetical protein